MQFHLNTGELKQLYPYLILIQTKSGQNLILNDRAAEFLLIILGLI